MKLKRILLLFVSGLLYLAHTNLALGQTATDSTATYKIETRDGNQYIGKIILESADYIQLKTDRLGNITISKSDIKTSVVVDPARMRNGQFWFDNPQATRYLFSPNGYGLRKGEGYYQNILVLVNQVSIGITDNISLGIGMVPLFPLGSSTTPVWFLPKVSVPVIKDKFNIGAGALVGNALGEDQGGFGIAYGISTFGSKDANVSLGLGYGYAGGGWAKSPTITINGLVRAGARSYLITENYIIGTSDGTEALISIGGRRIVKRVGLDFGLVAPILSIEDQFIAIPFLGLTVPFGKVKASN